MQDGLYVITNIKYGYQYDVFFGQGYPNIAFSGKIFNRTKGTTNKLTASDKENYML
jgi:hypothetical protein